jgi:hypothetical protein
MPSTTTDEVTPADINRGHLIPETYEGNLRTFVMINRDQVPIASGAVFSDGRIAVMSQTGQTYQRYTNTAALMEDWWGRGMLLWTPERGPVDYDVAPRRFLFERHEDETGISGEGIALEGVVFPHGGVVLMWLGEVRSFVEWPSLELALAMHGHEGRTRLKWLDPA